MMVKVCPWRLVGCALLFNALPTLARQGLRGLFAWQTATPYTDPDGLCEAGATGYRATKDCSGFVFCNNGYLMGGGEDGEAIGSVTKCDAGMKYDEAAGGCTATGGVNCPTNGVSSSESSSSSSIEEEGEAFIEQDQPEPSTSPPIDTEEEEDSKPSNSAFNSYYNRPYGPNGLNTPPTPPSATPTETESDIIDTQAPTSLAIMPNDEPVANIIVQGVLDMEPLSSTFDIVTFNTSDEVKEAEDFEEQEEEEEEVTTETGKGWKGETYAPACPESFTGNVAYPECKGYATCINGIFVGAPVECSAGLLFDKALGLCDFESNVVCDEEVDTDSDGEDEMMENEYEEVEEEMDDESIDEELSPINETLSPTPFETPSPTSSMTQNAVLFYDKLQGSEEDDSSLIVDKTSAPTLMTTERDVDNDGENWSVIESYTYRPTPQPNIPMSMSPVTLYEGDPAKRFCGYSWRDVIDSCLTAIPCPGGDSFGVCPDRMGCIADTPCADETYLNYLRGRQQEVAESQQPASSPPTVFATSSMTSTPPTDVATTMLTSDTSITASIEAMTTSSSVYENILGNVFFCAFTYAELTSQCLQGKPCPSGIASDFCESTQGCFAATSCTDEYELAGSVTIVSAPPTTDIPSTPTPQTTVLVSVSISTAAPSNIVSLSTEQSQSLTVSTEQSQSLTLSTEQAIADAWLSNTQDEEQVLNDPIGHLPPLPSPIIRAKDTEPPTMMYTRPLTESPTMLYAMAVEASTSEFVNKEPTPMPSELESTVNLIETTSICKLCGDSEINTSQLVNLDGNEVSCNIFDLVFSSANIEDGSNECFDYRGQYFSSCCRVQSVDDVQSIIEKCILCSDSVPNEETVVLFAGEELLCTEVATRLLVEDEISSDSEICETSKSSYSDMCCLQDTGAASSGVMASSGFAQTTPEIAPEYWLSMSLSNQASTRSTIWMYLAVLGGLLLI